MRHQPPAFSPLPLTALIRCVVPRRGGAEATLRSTIRQRFSVEDALLCGSGTQALQVALELACEHPERRNDLVALPAYTCFDVASAAIGASVRVIFYDVDPETLTPDMESLDRAVGRGPAAVVVAPLFGYQPDWDALIALAEQHHVTLVEDAAQSFGARWRGRTVGGLGHLSVLSFGRGKGWTAVEGGALLGPASELAGLSASLPRPRPTLPPAGRVLSKGVLQWAFGRPSLYGIPSAVPGLNLGETVFHPPVAPRAINPLSARLALETLRAAEAEAEARRKRATALMDRLAAEAPPYLRVPRADTRSKPGSLRLPVLAPPEARRQLLARGAPLGIMPSYPRPLPELAPLRSQIAERSPYPGAEDIAERLVTLPTHSLVTERDMGRVFALLRDSTG